MASILLLPGDGVGPEVVAQAEKAIDAIRRSGKAIECERAPIGGSAYDSCGDPLPGETLDLAKRADAVLLGAVGGPKYDALEFAKRPERGLLGIRSGLGLFANLRPVVCLEELADRSPLRPELVGGLDILIVRELTGGIYFAEPRGIGKAEDGSRRGVNTLAYGEHEIRRILRVGFDAAKRRSRRLHSVDKANVLECSVLWREVADETAKEYPEVELSHMLVDNAAMQLVRAPSQFDVVVTDNMFGDILSDEASMLAGSIGMLPSASLNEQGKGLYEPVHGSAPDIAGEDKANPLAALLSLAMLLRHSLGEDGLAAKVEAAVCDTVRDGWLTADLAGDGKGAVGTGRMGDLVAARLTELLGRP